MITSSKNRNKPYVWRKVLKLGHDRLYFFRTEEPPRTGYWRKTEHGFVLYMTGMKYNAIMVF